MDTVEIVDEQDNIIGTATLREIHQTGALHRVAVVYVTNASGRILIQERTPDGQLDHSAAGHVDEGESYEETAHREMFEEIGIKGAMLKEIGMAKSEALGPKSHRRHIFKVYVTQAEYGVLNPEEVLGVHWADAQDVWEDMQTCKENKYTETFRESIKVYLDYMNNK